MSKKTALLVGAGGMGKAWARNLLAVPDQVEIGGWVDLREDAALKASDELSVNAKYLGTDLEKAISEVKPDFVVDVTIPEAHHDVTITSLNAGVPVLGEKPMADSMERAKAMVATSERSGKLYMVSQSRRYDGGIQALRKLVSEQLGSVGIINASFYIGAHFGGFRDAMLSPLIVDMAIHTFDAARYASDLDPEYVYCDEFNPMWSWYDGNASATAIFEMSGGARFTYCGSWCAEGCATSWESEWRIAGERGTALWSGRGDDAPKAEIAVGDPKFQRDVETIESRIQPVRGGIAGSLQEFLHALETGSTPMGECHDNIKSLAMVYAAVESAEAKTRVKIQI